MSDDGTRTSELVRMLVHGTTYQMLDAAAAIGTIGEGAVLDVAPLLRSVHRETRWRAAVALERVGPPAVEALMVAAGDQDWRVRVPAIWALEHIGDSRSIPSLMENLHGKNECCRWMAAAALNRIGDEGIRQTVEEVFVADPFGRGVVEELSEGS